MNIGIFVIGVAGILLMASEVIHANSMIANKKEEKSSLANPVVSTKILTSVKYRNTLVYVYGSVSNEAESKATPAKCGFTQVSTRNLASISGDQHVLSKTVADGGNMNSKYIHRGQRDSFVSAYAANVRSVIYLESANAYSNLTAGLQDQFASLFDKGSDFV
jgi:hypothetical protein